MYLIMKSTSVFDSSCIKTCMKMYMIQNIHVIRSYNFVRSIFNLNIYLNISKHLLTYLGLHIKCRLCCSILAAVTDTVQFELRYEIS
jgi:hypothetical protein